MARFTKTSHSESQVLQAPDDRGAAVAIAEAYSDAKTDGGVIIDQAPQSTLEPRATLEPSFEKPEADEALALEPEEEGTGEDTGEDTSFDQGRRARRVITQGDFMPGRDGTWAIRHVAIHPRGYRVTLGHLIGAVLNTERKSNQVKEKTLESVWFHGAFEGQVINPDTGEVEVLGSETLILPLAFGEQIEAAFKAGAERVELDIDVAIESTGRTPPYEWAILSYREGRAQKALRGLRARQAERLAAQAAKKAKALTGPAKS
jgi:hypothetical protein